MVDLCIHQQHGGDAAVTAAAGGLKLGGGADLRQDVGRGVDEHPVRRAFFTHDERGLGACMDDGVRGVGRGGVGRNGGLTGCAARQGAVAAIAVPLGKAAAGGGAQDFDFHARGSRP